MSKILLEEFIKLIFESKLPPGNNGTATGRSGFSKNRQTSGFAGGDGRVLSKDQTIQDPNDHLYYHYMKIDGPNQDLESDLTTATCEVDVKFKDLLPKELQKYNISAKGADAEQEVQTKINQFFLKIKNVIDSNLNNNLSLNSNFYNNIKKTNQSW
jgi:hypothetical protein